VSAARNARRAARCTRPRPWAGRGGRNLNLASPSHFMNEVERRGTAIIRLGLGVCCVVSLAQASGMGPCSWAKSDRANSSNWSRPFHHPARRTQWVCLVRYSLTPKHFVRLEAPVRLGEVAQRACGRSSRERSERDRGRLRGARPQLSRRAPGRRRSEQGSPGERLFLWCGPGRLGAQNRNELTEPAAD
jgi:hypothetical protein